MFIAGIFKSVAFSIVLSGSLALAACAPKRAAAVVKPGAKAAPAVSAHPTVNLALSPDRTALAVGDPLVLTFGVSNEVRGLYGVAADLSYDPAVFEFVGAQQLSGWFKQTRAVWELKNGQPGTVVLALTKEGPLQGDTGTGAIFQLTLRAKAAGTANLDLADVGLLDDQGGEIPLALGALPAITVK